MWDGIYAAVNGDTKALGHLLERDPNLSKYDQPLYFALRESQVGAAPILFDAGADGGEELLTLAQDRGHEGLVRLLEENHARLGRVKPDALEHLIHLAAADGGP